MRIATWNINSVHLRAGLIQRFVKEVNPDIICLQETKVQDSEFPLEALQSTGYIITFRGMKGDNGVAVLTKTIPFQQSCHDTVTFNLMRNYNFYS